MRWPSRYSGSAVFVIFAAALALLHACQDTSKLTEVDGTALVVTKTVTVVGSGTGDGTVQSSPTGINCVVTKGIAAATGCKASFNQGVTVTLTATPNAGHAFKGWLKACTGTGTCTLSMTVNRTVDARFLKGPFKITIGSGGGTGSGRVTSQAGLTPVIDCTITSGTPAATGCSARFPAQTVLVLTATPAVGSTFTDWGSPCSGAATCQHAVVQSRPIDAVFAPGGSSTAAREGQWDPTFPTTVLGIHTHLLPTGKVLLWGKSGDAQLWDPANPTAGFTSLIKPFKIFCSGHTFLPDGRLLIAGGLISGINGDASAVIFDPSTNTFNAIDSLAQGRYYPTTTVLPNGEILAISGSDEAGITVPIPELGDGSTWRKLTSASLSIPDPWYPRTFVAPNGKIFLAGFQATTRYLSTTGDGEWTTVGDRIVADRTLGSAVSYAPGKILYVGGGDPPTNSAEVIDLNQAAPAWRSVDAMQFARRHLNATILADGQVLVTHGTSSAGFNNSAGGVLDAELWNPETETWTTMAREAAVRVYHSAALLLPDGRVLSSGSGEGGGIPLASSQLTAQIYSPPYLFNANGTLAQRPAVTSAPSRISYGVAFTVETPAAGSITRGNLIRLSSVTHAFNMSQVNYPLTFEATGATTLRATGPASGNLAPPGPYMLFLLSSQGAPSMAKMVTVGP